MKFVLFFFIMLPQAFAGITSAERLSAISMAKTVMAEVSSRPEAKLINAHVTDEIGTRVLVEFAFVESVDEGSQKCTYSFDRVLSKVVSGSWGCER
ncbi:MAG: hypothetical protein V4598_05210 [Bdellovibrionota bacterium]